ncbi:MAG: GGDEF domain-containing protein [Acidobacteria bacterium]|nr:GGDEF domain-containing protein [Acidobacteriota bacterium]
MKTGPNKGVVVGDHVRQLAIMKNLCFVVAAVLIPIAAFNITQDPLIGWVNFICIAGLVTAGMVMRTGKRLPWHGVEILLLVSLVIFVSVLRQGHIGVYWSFVLVPCIHFSLKRIAAIAYNCGFVIVLGYLCFDVFGGAETLRIVLSHGLMGWVIAIFSAKVLSHQNALASLAIVDPLTQTYNRRHLDDMLNEAVHEFSRYKVPFSIIVYDLDHFKRVNDELGHETGDIVLQKLCHVVMARMRKSDLVFRYGGEEFVIILRHTHSDRALDVAKDLVEIVSRSEILRERKITMSCGVSEYREGESVQELIRRADEALYEAKRLGRNRAHLAARDRRAAVSYAD